MDARHSGAPEAAAGPPSAEYASPVDRPTLDWYERHAREVEDAYESVGGRGAEALFDEAFPPGARVLDLGAGTGRNLAALLAGGRDAFGLEPVAAFHAICRERHAGAAERLLRGALPDGLRDAARAHGPFRGILAVAVLMHLDRADLLATAAHLPAALEPGGRLLASIPLDRPGLDSRRRDDRGRLFADLTPEGLTEALAPAGLRLLRRVDTDDPLRRPGHRWAVLLYGRTAAT